MKLGYGDAALVRAVVDGGGVAAVVAAMRQLAAVSEVQRSGCGALASLTFDEVCTQAVVDAGGVAAVVAAMGQHAAYAGLQRFGSCMMSNVSCGDAACKQAVVDAGGVAALVAAMLQHAADAVLHVFVRARVARALLLDARRDLLEQRDVARG